MTEELRTKLQGMVDSHDIVLFMKGKSSATTVRFFPARVVSIRRTRKLIIKPTTYSTPTSAVG